MSCYKYWGTIAEIADKLSSFGNLDEEGLSALDDTDIKEITEILDDIEVIAHDKEIDFDSAKHILDDEKMNKALTLIRKFYVYIGARLETENALKILESDDPKAALDSFHFYERYIGLIENERQLAKFNENKTLVFLGSGPLPLTLIMFNKVTGCKCIGIEQDAQVAQLSRKVLKKLELDEDIKIITGDEKTIANLDYDILMIAAFAVPKDRVFGNIWEIVDEKTPILFRTYSGMRAILYAPVTDRDTRGFHKEIMLLPKGKTNNTSVLMRKIN
ncbi:nicotianamine synthase family protein [Methanosphaera sp. WGK6]|uniref:nicotianamine synthase family protein n=1 Tax=Methanosphaera sp. WGK6 TaxID=1561964 RepID=UPI00084BDB81|nr:nicotianamine synthase family protein [Methanosphaera sp. WGK6]OED29934.1 methyltransferase [Methanosphaera sp. WGK6]